MSKHHSSEVNQTDKLSLKTPGLLPTRDLVVGGGGGGVFSLWF